MGDYKQNPNSPLRTPEGFAAEFGLPYKKKKRRWNVTEGGFKRVSSAGKGDHRRTSSAEDRAKFAENYDKIDWKKEEKTPLSL